MSGTAMPSFETDTNSVPGGRWNCIADARISGCHAKWLSYAESNSVIIFIWKSYSDLKPSDESWFFMLSSSPMMSIGFSVYPCGGFLRYAMLDCHLTNSFMSSISRISPSLSSGTDCRHFTPSSAGTTGRAPADNFDIALLITAQGSWPVVEEGDVEFVDCVVVDAAVVVSSVTATTSLMSAWVMTSFMSRSG